MKPLHRCGHTLFHESCGDCQELQDYYYRKLKEQDFKDIEDQGRSERLLKSWHSFKFCLMEPEQREGPESYYRLATEVLHTYPFEKPVHRFIWELHCEGKSKREIESILSQSEYPKKYKRESILNLIHKIAREMILV